jgi:multiple sugar transport system ATP-binding protein
VKPLSEVVLERVSKRFPPAQRGEPEHAALSDVSIEVEKGEMLVVVGPSGCGKSTTLRLIAGLDDPDSGTISVAGKPMRDVAPQNRDVAMVFQGYALYPQMTVRENIEFPLKMRGVPAADRAKASDEAARLLRIEKLLARRPPELSGGERQRVAMGRAIVRKPKVFLFDEPLSNLDAALRSELRVEIGALVRRLGATAIYVTHDQVEAMTLADRICVMRAGRVQQIATPRELYEKPANAFVGAFLGSPKMNVIRGRAADGAIVAGPFRIERPDVKLPREVDVGFRAEDVRVAEGRGEACWEILASEPLGAETHLVLRAGGDEVRAKVPGFDPRKPGDKVALALDASRVHLFDPGSDGARIA